MERVQLKIPELKRWLQCRDASTKGKKSDLVRRLATEHTGFIMNYIQLLYNYNKNYIITNGRIYICVYTCKGVSIEPIYPDVKWQQDCIPQLESFYDDYIYHCKNKLVMITKIW